jgi:TPR repeat protein
MTRILRIIFLTAVLGAGAFPVNGYFQSHSFFNPELKYREWFHVTRWPGEERTQHRTYAGLAAKAAIVSAAQRYAFPDRKFVMTDALWKNSKRKVETGVSDWFDAEIVRQRAEIEEHPPAMDFLAWMYEHGQGIKQDQRKAFMWYERAKLAGEKELRGVSERIFDRMTPPDQNLAQVQLADDVKRLTPETEAAPLEYKQINLRVFRQRRGADFYRQQQEQLERERKPIHR